MYRKKGFNCTFGLEKGLLLNIKRQMNDNELHYYENIIPMRRNRIVESKLDFFLQIFSI